jgi:hypothetical protein
MPISEESESLKGENPKKSENPTGGGYADYADPKRAGNAEGTPRNRQGHSNISNTLKRGNVEKC